MSIVVRVLLTMSAVALLSGCPDATVREICETGGSPHCCQISKRDSNDQTTYRSYCTSNCSSCVPSNSTESALCPANDKSYTEIKGCVTGTHKAGVSELPTFLEVGRLGRYAFDPSIELPRFIRIAAVASEGDCKATCRDSPEFCKSLVPDLDRAAQLQELSKKLASRPAILATEELHRIFSVDPSDDPCGRSDTTFASDGTFSNQGSGNCLIAAQVTKGPEGGADPLVLVVPEKLSGQLDIVGEVMTYSFHDASEAMRLRVDDASNDDLSGGVITQMQATRESLFVSTDDACMRIDFASNQ